MELFVSDDGTWTLMISQPNGISCMIAGGDDWIDVPYIPDAPREKI